MRISQISEDLFNPFCRSHDVPRLGRAGCRLQKRHRLPPVLLGRFSFGYKYGSKSFWRLKLAEKQIMLGLGVFNPEPAVGVQHQSMTPIPNHRPPFWQIVLYISLFIMELTVKLGTTISINFLSFSVSQHLAFWSPHHGTLMRTLRRRLLWAGLSQACLGRREANQDPSGCFLISTVETLRICRMSSTSVVAVEVEVVELIFVHFTVACWLCDS